MYLDSVCDEPLRTDSLFVFFYFFILLLLYSAVAGTHVAACVYFDEWIAVNYDSDWFVGFFFSCILCIPSAAARRVNIVFLLLLLPFRVISFCLWVKTIQVFILLVVVWFRCAWMDLYDCGTIDWPLIVISADERMPGRQQSHQLTNEMTNDVDEIAETATANLQVAQMRYANTWIPSKTKNWLVKSTRRAN